MKIILFPTELFFDILILFTDYLDISYFYLFTYNGIDFKLPVIFYVGIRPSIDEK